MSVFVAGGGTQGVPSVVVPAAAAWTPASLASLKFDIGGWNPATLYTDAGTTPVASDGDLVYQANDYVSGLHVSQASSGNRPVYKTAIQNGLSVLRFDGASDSLTRASVALQALVASNACTLVFVLYQGGVANNNEFRLAVSDDSNAVALYFPYSGNFYFNTANNVGGGQISGTVPGGFSGTFHILVAWRSGGTAKIYVDGGTEIGSGSVTDALDNMASTGTLQIGGDGTIFFGGDLGRLLVCNEGLSTANLNLLGAYLAAQWGLSWTTIT